MKKRKRTWQINEQSNKAETKERSKTTRIIIAVIVLLGFLSLPLIADASPELFVVLIVGGAFVWNIMMFFPRKRGATLGEIDEREFLAWAREHELTPMPTDYDLIKLLEPLGIFGKYRPVFKGARGAHQGFPFWVGKLTIYDDGVGGADRPILNDMIAVIRHPYRFQHTLIVEPKQAKHTIIRELENLPIVGFESADFNEAYIAHSEDPRFAHACVTPLVMEQLLRYPNSEILQRDGLLVVNAADSDSLSRFGAARLLAVAGAFMATLPAYLKEEATPD